MSRDLLTRCTSSGLLLVQLMASVIVLTVLSLRERPLQSLGRPLFRGSLAGVLEPGLTYSLSLAGLAVTTAGNASVIAASEPLLIAVLAWILLRQRPSGRLVLAISGGVIGLALVSGSSLTAWDEPSRALGDGLVLLATVFAAAYVIVSARAAATLPAATLATAQQLVGLAFAVLVHLVLETTGFEHQDWSLVTASVLAVAVVSGALQHALPFWLYLIGLRCLRPARAGLWITRTLVFGLTGAAVWLGETLSTTTLIGTGVILAALLLNRESPARDD